MFVEKPIYIRYVVLTIVIFTSMLVIELSLYYTTLLFSWMFLWVLTSLCPLPVCGISLTRFRDFRKFWPSSFVDPLVKGVDNLWKILGLIDGFNESCRHIASGVGKTADESMSAIRFCTTPKGYLPHYSFILRKPDTLGTEMKNVVCLRLGTMLNLYTHEETSYCH